MSPELKSQIRDLYHRIDELQAPVELNEILEPRRPVTLTGLAPAPVDRSRTRRTLIAAAAAAVVALVVGVPIWLSLVVESPVITIAHPDPVESVQAALSTYNEGDWEAFAARYVVADVRSGANRTLLGSLMAARNQITVLDSCSVDPGQGGETDARVACRLQMRDDFHGAAGLEVEVAATFVVNDQGLLVNSDFGWLQEGWQRYGPFDRAFGEWLSDAYPEEHALLVESLSSGNPNLPFREEIGSAFGNLPGETAMPIALARVVEFVEQSPDYDAP